MTANAQDIAVYEGVVIHQRFKPVSHRLRYKVFSFLFDLDALDETSASLRFLSRNKFNLFSFYDSDHGFGKPQEIAGYIREILKDAAIDANGKILLLCYPRMLGYAFNPLAVYYCYDKEERLAAMIYEVRNTFGAKHSYLIPADGHSSRVKQSIDKVFHVSPFIDMNMRYEFSLSHPGEKISVAIQTVDPEGPLLHAAFHGRAAPVTDKKLFALFFRYPLMTLKVIAGIHWEAARLLLKGLRLRGGDVPDRPVTIAQPQQCETNKAA